MAFVGGMGGQRGLAGPIMHASRRNGDSDQDIQCSCLKIQRSKKNKPVSKVKLLKERIRQFSIWYYEEQEQIDKDFFRRRVQRKEKKTKHVSTNMIRLMRFLYALDITVWLVGLVFVLCSSVEAFGQHTFFYESQRMYRIIGVFIIVFAVVLLLIVTGVKHRARTKHHKPRRNFYIINKKSKCTCNDTDNFKNSKANSKETSEDSGNEEDIDGNARKTVFNKQTNANNEGARRKQLYYYKNVDSAQCSFEMSPVASTSGNSSQMMPVTEIEDTGQGIGQSRRAWTKSRWMRFESDDDSLNAVSIVELPEYEEASLDIVTQTSDYARASAKTKRQMFQMKSQNTSSNDSDDLFMPMYRNYSTKSKVSQASSVSNNSETAPLVKR